jgi:hypothetical protein
MASGFMGERTTGSGAVPGAEKAKGPFGKVIKWAANKNSTVQGVHHEYVHQIGQMAREKQYYDFKLAKKTNKKAVNAKAGSSNSNNSSAQFGEGTPKKNTLGANLTDSQKAKLTKASSKKTVETAPAQERANPRSPGLKTSNFRRSPSTASATEAKPSSSTASTESSRPAPTKNEVALNQARASKGSFTNSTLEGKLKPSTKGQIKKAAGKTSPVGGAPFSYQLDQVGKDMVKKASTKLDELGSKTNKRLGVTPINRQGQIPNRNSRARISK